MFNVENIETDIAEIVNRDPSDLHTISKLIDLLLQFLRRLIDEIYASENDWLNDPIVMAYQRLNKYSKSNIRRYPDKLVLPPVSFGFLTIDKEIEEFYKKQNPANFLNSDQKSAIDATNWLVKEESKRSSEKSPITADRIGPKLKFLK